MQSPTEAPRLGLLGAVSERFTGSTLMESRGLKYAVYALALGIVIAVIILVSDTFFPFLPVNPISGPSAAARTGKVFWTSSSNTDAENQMVPASESPTVSPNTYSMSVQLMIGAPQAGSTGHFRHVLHRGSNPCALSVTSAGPTGHAGIKIGDLMEDFKADPQYVMTGLPAVMNPGLFLDKSKNDLHVFVHTKGKQDTSNVLWLESITIEDLPLATPITIGVICNGQSLEVYVNCRLYSTLLLKGTPYLPKADNQWFGRYCAFPMPGLIKNLELWPSALGSSDYIQMCRTGSFNKSDLPASCPS